MMTETSSADRPDGERASDAVVRLVAFCVLWVLVGTWIGPALRPSPLLGAETWLLAACPVVFWLGRRLAGRQAIAVPLALSLLALILMLGPWSVHPNDLATLLALLLPWWLVLALIPQSRGWPRRLARAAAAFITAAALWSTGSRGGILAAAVGLVAALILAHPRRRQLVLTLLLLAVSLPAIWTATEGTRPHEAVRGWILDHDAEGITWEHLSTGRPMLWRQATRVISDFPLFGTGVGSYGVLVPDVYPPPLRRIDLPPEPPRVPDAHQLYLETAVAFGVPAMLAFLALCSAGLWRLADRALRERNAAPAAAFGGLLAYLIHGVGDCAAPGSVVYAAGWLALGFACRRRTFRVSPGPAFGARAFGAVAALLVLTVAVVRLLPDEVRHRRAVLTVLDTDTAAAPELRRDWDSDDACREAWWRERLAVATFSPSTSEAVAVARCAPHRLSDIMALSPFDGARAAAVYNVRPLNPDALLWHLWTTPVGPGIEHGYYQYFALRPEDGEVRMEFLRRLGGAWTRDHPRLALAFLAQACAHGDPGANACYGAGNLAHQLELGDAVADSFYLASQWPGARRLATTKPIE